jgi:hypothetical protein
MSEFRRARWFCDPTTSLELYRQHASVHVRQRYLGSEFLISLFSSGSTFYVRILLHRAPVTDGPRQATNTSTSTTSTSTSSSHRRNCRAPRTKSRIIRTSQTNTHPTLTTDPPALPVFSRSLWLSGEESVLSSRSLWLCCPWRARQELIPPEEG